jgi:pyridoxal phosphate enzyme (YggS family)
MRSWQIAENLLNNIMTIEENFSAIRRDIAAACQASGRDPLSVQLVAASKMQPPQAIDAALAAGHRVFGENRVQDAWERWKGRRLLYPDLRLHLIGSLQTNKVKDAVALFDVIETVDRESLARELAKEMARQNKSLSCFIQVNTGEEEQKGGVVPQKLTGLLKACRDLDLHITGLMCIPPVDEPPELHVALLKKLAARHGLHNLSMGMSADFKKAIAIGATSVRIGTALFGGREGTPPA